MSATAGACACAREDAAEWIRVGFGDCVYDRADAVGFAFGMLSIACWLVAQLPQFVQNFRSGSAEGLSPWFLAEWLLGDTFNLLGCVMTGDQLPSETYTAAYFMCVDVLMIFQFVYYSLRSREALAIITVDLRDPGDDRGRREEDRTMRARLLGGDAGEHNDDDSDENDDDSDDDDDSAAYEYERGVVRERWDRAAASPIRRSGSASGAASGVDRIGSIGAIAVAGATVVGVAMGLCAVASASGANGFGFGRRGGAFAFGAHGTSEDSRGRLHSGTPTERFFEEGDGIPRDLPRTSDLPLCGSTNNPPWEVAFGRAVGYVSALFYLGSRVSQILKNKKRGSCEGLSVSMFATAAVANVLYGLAIIVRANGSPSALLESTPWLLGSLGTVALDSTILAQSRLYGDEDETATEEEAEEESILT